MSQSQPTRLRRQSSSVFQIVGIGFAIFAIGSFLILNREPVFSVDSPSNSGKDAPAVSSNNDSPQYSVVINQPDGPPRVETGQTDSTGNPLTVACSTCHSVRPPNLENKAAADLDEFHAGMKFGHGSVSCLSCHNPNDYDTLKLADGSPIEYANVMKLCAQCHGPQTRDYENGAHGGMTGHWDLKRGPRARNNCIDCHDPHAPQFPKMNPTFKPRDRFLNGESKESKHE